MKKKRIILSIVALLVVAGVVWGLISLRSRHNKAYVQPVEELNNSWVLMNESSSGTITQSAQQKIYLKPTDLVSQVFVTQGQEVAQGDALFQYDTQSLELSVQERQLDVDSCAGSLDIAKQQLAAYQSIQPVAAHEEWTEPQPFTLSEAQRLPEPEEVKPESVDPSAQQGDETEGGEGDEPNTDDPEGARNTYAASDTSPTLLYRCTEETIITGEQINEWVANQDIVALQFPGDELRWKLDGRNFLTVADDSYWRAADLTMWLPPEPAAEEPAAPTYTQAEKDKLISDQNLAIRRLENSLALAQNALAQAKKSLDDTTVKASMAGTVTAIGDPADPPKDGSAFCTVSGASGVTLTGYISELDLADARVGDKLSVSSWMTGITTDAEITGIADYPADTTQFYMGEGNPNASYYEFTAYMENADGFEAGEDVNIQPYIENVDQIIVLEKVYVRSDGDGAYVMVDDGAGRLTRRDVTVQRTSDSEYVKVLTGLTGEDFVAFPYGPAAKEGTQTTTVPPLTIF